MKAPVRAVAGSLAIAVALGLCSLTLCACSGVSAGGSSVPLESAQDSSETSPVASVEPTASTQESQPEPDPYAEKPHLLALVYHHVHPTQSNYLTITPETFEAHLESLTAAGYQGITASQLAACVASGTPLPERSVLITFDDAWRNQYDYAVPALEKHGFPATFFAYRSVIGGGGFMSQLQLNDLASRGFEIHSHSLRHDSLIGEVGPSDGAAFADAVAQLVQAREWAAGFFGSQRPAFAYPYGHYDEFTVPAVQQAGYSIAFTVDDGVNPLEALDPFLLRRFTVFRADTQQDFESRLGAVLMPLTARGPLTADHPSAGELTLWCEIAPTERLDAQSVRFAIDAEEAATTVIDADDKLRFEATTRLDPGFHYVAVHARLEDGRMAHEAWGLVVK